MALKRTRDLCVQQLADYRTCVEVPSETKRGIADLLSLGSCGFVISLATCGDLFKHGDDQFLALLVVLNGPII